MPIMKLEDETGAVVAWMDGPAGAEATRTYGLVLARCEAGADVWRATQKGEPIVTSDVAARYDAMEPEALYVDDGTRRWTAADSRRLHDERAAILDTKK